MKRCSIALGSNLGDRAFFLREARSHLARLEGVKLLACSWVYETQPVGPVGQGPFLNAVLQIDSTLGAMALLEKLLDIERQLGRERTVRWGPRLIDMDLLLYGDEVIDEAQLTVPHPQLAQRAFVLVPLAEIAGEVVHPQLGRTIAQLRDAVDVSGVKRIEIDDWLKRSS